MSPGVGGVVTTESCAMLKNVFFFFWYQYFLSDFSFRPGRPEDPDWTSSKSGEECAATPRSSPLLLRRRRCRRDAGRQPRDLSFGPFQYTHTPLFFSGWKHLILFSRHFDYFSPLYIFINQKNHFLHEIKGAHEWKRRARFNRNGKTLESAGEKNTKFPFREARQSNRRRPTPFLFWRPDGVDEWCQKREGVSVLTNYSIDVCDLI